MTLVPVRIMSVCTILLREWCLSDHSLSFAIKNLPLPPNACLGFFVPFTDSSVYVLPGLTKDWPISDCSLNARYALHLLDTSLARKIYSVCNMTLSRPQVSRIIDPLVVLNRPCKNIMLCSAPVLAHREIIPARSRQSTSLWPRRVWISVPYGWTLLLICSSRKNRYNAGLLRVLFLKPCGIEKAHSLLQRVIPCILLQSSGIRILQRVHK